MCQQVDKSNYLYNKKEFIGFTVILPDKEFKIAYIWFLAINAKYRSKGLGTKALQEINKKYNKYEIALDLERTDQTAENNEQRKRRIKFYEKNGYVRTHFGMTYLGVDYEILCNTVKFNNRHFQKFINKFQQMGFGYGMLYSIKEEKQEI